MFKFVIYILWRRPFFSVRFRWAELNEVGVAFGRVVFMLVTGQFATVAAFFEVSSEKCTL